MLEVLRNNVATFRTLRFLQVQVHLDGSVGTFAEDAVASLDATEQSRAPE